MKIFEAKMKEKKVLLKSALLRFVGSFVNKFKFDLAAFA